MLWKRRAWAAVQRACLVAATEGLEEFDVHHLVRRAFESIMTRAMTRSQARLDQELDSGGGNGTAGNREKSESCRPGGDSRGGSIIDHAFAKCAERARGLRNGGDPCGGKERTRARDR